MLDITRDDMNVLFGILDKDRSGDISYQEFVEQLHYMGTVNQRTVLAEVKYISTATQELLAEVADCLPGMGKKTTLGKNMTFSFAGSKDVDNAARLTKNQSKEFSEQDTLSTVNAGKVSFRDADQRSSTASTGAGEMAQEANQHTGKVSLRDPVPKSRQGVSQHIGKVSFRDAGPKSLQGSTASAEVASFGGTSNHTHTAVTSVIQPIDIGWLQSNHDELKLLLQDVARREDVESLGAALGSLQESHCETQSVSKEKPVASHSALVAPVFPEVGESLAQSTFSLPVTMKAPHALHPWTPSESTPATVVASSSPIRGIGCCDRRWGNPPREGTCSEVALI